MRLAREKSKKTRKKISRGKDSNSLGSSWTHILSSLKLNIGKQMRYHYDSRKGFPMVDDKRIPPQLSEEHRMPTQSTCYLDKPMTSLKY